MTTLEMIRRIRSAWHEELQGFYTTGTTSADGTASTFICYALSALADDFLNEKEICITSGLNSGLRREIVDWSAGTFTGMVLEQFPYAVADGVKFEIGERGFWSDQEIIAWLNDAAAETVRLLSNEALWDYLKNGTTQGFMVASQSYGRAALPDDCVKIPKAVWIDGRIAPFVDTDQKTRFDRDPYIGEAVILEGRPSGGSVQIIYKPYKDATITFLYAPMPAAFDTVIETTLPVRVHPILVDLAIRDGWKKAERIDLATKAEEKALRQIGVLNIEAQGKI